ncbi:Glycerophosphoryl diester phosphodiesterase [Triticum urartu]|uniref:glycerophosphodiester phosphodiesterase n=1 Tax=Triticum urartu TaxID=4572 RepID=M7ZRD4_TRIUA|nr:Glycerophosphoryl diester phosphodiesterase [Triticum urartu]
MAHIAIQRSAVIRGTRIPFFPLPSKTSNEEKKPIQTFRPYNIAHRGSNGEIPEETSGAYLRAIEEGADFIETDILASKDGALICFHDVTLDDTTDISSRKEFANRRRTYEVEWANVTGWCPYAVDFTLEELKTLKVKQRYPFRDQQYNGKFSIITFEEFISIALDASRTIGIYPEIKDPVFINKHVKWADGKKFEDKFVDTLLKYGYRGQYMSENWLKQPLFIQSFAPSSLVHVSKLTDSPKIFLIDDITVRTQDTNQSYWEITSDDYLAYISNYVVGLGPWKDTIVPVANNYLLEPTDLVARAHAHNLQVHPYTYRNENQFLHFDFHQDPYAEYDFWINTMGVDGLFTDFAGSVHKYQELKSPHPKDATANSLLGQGRISWREPNGVVSGEPLKDKEDLRPHSSSSGRMEAAALARLPEYASTTAPLTGNGSSFSVLTQLIACQAKDGRCPVPRGDRPGRQHWRPESRASPAHLPLRDHREFNAEAPGQRHVFNRIREGVVGYDDYFECKEDAVGKIGFSSYQKCTAAIRMFAYGVPGDLIDEYVRMSESTCLESLYKFCKAVIAVFDLEYLREPITKDTTRFVGDECQQGLPGDAWQHRLHALGVEELPFCLARAV